MKQNPELIFFPNVKNLEGPVWDKKRNSIWCIAIEEGLVFCVNIKTKFVRTYNMQSQVGCIGLCDNTFLAATYDGIFNVDIKTGKIKFLAQPLTNKTIRFNDGKFDPKGRFIVGTTGYNRLAENENFLFSWDGKKSTILLDRLTISNGLAFSNDNTYMYFIDTPTKKVGQYFYDLKTGTLKFDKYVISIEDDGLPDGMCIDNNENLYVAEWQGGKVCKWNSKTGEKLSEIKLPVKNVSSCCIGGENMDKLFITTAKHDDGTESEPMAGGLFVVEIDKDKEKSLC